MPPAKGPFITVEVSPNMRWTSLAILLVFTSRLVDVSFWKAFFKTHPVIRAPIGTFPRSPGVAGSDPSPVAVITMRDCKEFKDDLIHTHCSLAHLAHTHSFLGALILQRHCHVRWRARLPLARVLLLHTYTQVGWFLQPQRRLAGLSFPAVNEGVVECAPGTPYTYSLPHTGFPTSAHLSRLRLFRDICGAWFRFGSGFGIGFMLRLACSLASRAPLLLATHLSQNIPFPRIH